MTRFAIPDFALANRIYRGGRVHVYEIDDDGVKTDDLATLYEAPTGTGTLRNPQRLDGEGKFLVPVYIDEPVILTISGLGVPDHDTGIVRSLVGTPSYRGCAVHHSVDIVSPTYPYTMAFDTELFDTDTIHAASPNSRLTVPTGVTRVRLKARVSWTATIAAAAGTALTIYKNGSADYRGVGKATGGEAAYTTPTLECSTIDLVVVAGDYFQAVADTTDAVSTIDASDCWFMMEVLE